jgi:hypothetical protein
LNVGRKPTYCDPHEDGGSPLVSKTSDHGGAYCKEGRPVK